MVEKTNAQVALECATELKKDSHSAHAVKLVADDFKKWLDENTPVGLSK